MNIRVTTGRAGAKAAGTFRHGALAAMEEVQRLIATVEDLLLRLSGTADAELGRLRAQTEQAVAQAKAAVAEGAARVGERAGEMVERGDDYVREQPWTALGVTALAALVIGFWAGARLPNSR
jgi:ElaB/YqjD/DUF883 family membrane-anchored ribosome-binding protein